MLPRCKKSKDHPCKYGFPKVPILESFLTRCDPQNLTSAAIKKAKELRAHIQAALDDPSGRYLDMSTSEFYKSLHIDYQVSV